MPWGPQVNEFEQVTNDGHKVSVAGVAGAGKGGGGFPMFDVWGPVQ